MCVFVQKVFLHALEDEVNFDVVMAKKDKKIILKKTHHNTIILSLGDKVLRQVLKKIR